MPGVDDVGNPEAVRRPGDRDNLPAGGMRPGSASVRRHRDERVADAGRHEECARRERRRADRQPLQPESTPRDHREPAVDDRRDAVRSPRQHELRRHRARLRLGAQAHVKRADRGERASGDHEQKDRRCEGENGGAQPAPRGRDGVQRMQRAV